MIKKIFISFMIIILVLINSVISYYNYENRFKAFILNRNTLPANKFISYSQILPTNQDVEMNVNFDKVVSIIGNTCGVTLSNDGKQIYKTISENEANSLLIRDEDFNYQTLEYNVNWIDKEPPIISGAENGIIYNSNIHLDYSDNSIVKEIYADYYTDNFSVYTEVYDFCAQKDVRIVSSNRNSISVYILSNTREMEKYNYYIDGVLKATTHDKVYKFTNLEYSENEHHIVVEALDRYGNILETAEFNRKTIPIDALGLLYDSGREYIELWGVPETLTSITAQVWCEGKANSMFTYTPTRLENGNYYIIVDRTRHRNCSGKYIIIFTLNYIENGIAKATNIGGYVYLPYNYNTLDYTNLPNDFTENGNYYVRCTDEAGNETEIDFTIQK